VRLAAIFAGAGRAATEQALRGLRLANRDAERVASVATHAEELRRDLEANPAIGEVQLRRWAALTGRVDLADTLRVAMAVSAAAASGGTDRGRAHCRLYRRAVRCAWRDPVEISDLMVDGEDLMREAGVPPGPRVGHVLRALREWVLVDPARNSRDLLLRHARELETTS
jgi:tRNA nucleotidyltransferase (CCA-adding enzyme)